MKKLWILLVVLAVMGAAPLFADVTLSGELMGYAQWDFQNPGSSAFPKVELNGMVEVDDFNTVKFELDSEGDDFAGNVAVDDFRLITDWGKALGLPIGIKTTFGYFDTYFTGWYYYDATGWTWYYDWPDGVVEQGPTTAGALQVDVAVGPATIHWYNDGAGEDFMVGADFAFGDFSAWLAYDFVRFTGIGEGVISVEAAYAIMDMANVGAFFRFSLGDNVDQYALGDGDFTAGLNVGASFGMFHAAIGLEGDSVSDNFLDNGIFEVSVAPTDAAKIAVAAFLDLGGANAFAGLDISGSYMVGAAKFAIGYAYAPEGTSIVVFPSGDNYAANGLYAGVYIAY
jgi:hypothetical protein